MSASGQLFLRDLAIRLRVRWATIGKLMLIVGNAGADQRFPLPEFESGYKLPGTTTPGARELWWEYVDVAVLLGALSLATWLIHRKRSRTGLAWLSGFSVAYFGFFRKGCICAIGSAQNVAMGLFHPDYKIPLVALLFFMLPVAFALWGGRSFCSAVCPHGALQDLVLLKPVKIPAWAEQTLSLFPLLFLGAGVAFAATGAAFIVCRYDPFVPVFRFNGRLAMVALGIGLLALGMFVGRPYCRFLCPYGALLRLAANVSKWKITTTPGQCTQCRLCEQSCPYGAMRLPSTPPAQGPELVRDRRRLGRYILLLPVLVLAGAWWGAQFSVEASRLHPTVALAERLVGEQRVPHPGPATPEDLALRRAEQNPKDILAQANDMRERFYWAGILFGVWAGLIVGGKLIRLSLHDRRHDFEPDRGACVACARCFSYCPEEWVRRGLSPSDESAGSSKPLPLPMPAPNSSTISAS